MPYTTVPDPSHSQSFNRYSYVYNNPVNYTDPTGNFAWWIVGLIVVAVVRVLVMAVVQGMVAKDLMVGLKYAVMSLASLDKVGAKAVGLYGVAESVWNGKYVAVGL